MRGVEGAEELAPSKGLLWLDEIAGYLSLSLCQFDDLKFYFLEALSILIEFLLVY